MSGLGTNPVLLYQYRQVSNDHSDMVACVDNYFGAQVTHTNIDIHFTVNFTVDKIVHMRNNSDWSYVFTIEVDIMFCAKIENIAHYRTY